MRLSSPSGTPPPPFPGPPCPWQACLSPDSRINPSPVLTSVCILHMWELKIQHFPKDPHWLRTSVGKTREVWVRSRPGQFAPSKAETYSVRVPLGHPPPLTCLCAPSSGSAKTLMWAPRAQEQSGGPAGCSEPRCEPVTWIVFLEPPEGGLGLQIPDFQLSVLVQTFPFPLLEP